MSVESRTHHLESMELGFEQCSFAEYLDWVERVLLCYGPECEETCREVSVSPRKSSSIRGKVTDIKSRHAKEISTNTLIDMNVVRKVKYLYEFDRCVTPKFEPSVRRTLRLTSGLERCNARHGATPRKAHIIGMLLRSTRSWVFGFHSWQSML